MWAQCAPSGCASEPFQAQAGHCTPQEAIRWLPLTGSTRAQSARPGPPPGVVFVFVSLGAQRGPNRRPPAARPIFTETPGRSGCGLYHHHDHYSLLLLFLDQLCPLAFRTTLVFYVLGGMFQYAISAVPFVCSCGWRFGSPLPLKLVRQYPKCKLCMAQNDAIA